MGYSVGVPGNSRAYFPQTLIGRKGGVGGMLIKMPS